MGVANDAAGLVDSLRRDVFRYGKHLGFCISGAEALSEMADIFSRELSEIGQWRRTIEFD